MKVNTCQTYFLFVISILEEENNTHNDPINILRSFEFSYDQKLIMETLNHLNLLVFLFILINVCYQIDKHENIKERMIHYVAFLIDRH